MRPTWVLDPLGVQPSVEVRPKVRHLDTEQIDIFNHERLEYKLQAKLFKILILLISHYLDITNTYSNGIFDWFGQGYL
jgi:hypothetical protein